MPAAKQATLIEIDDCKIAQMTADTGAAPTYAAAIDVPNIVELVVTPNLKTAVLEGDAVVDSIYQKVTHLTGTIRFNSVPLDVLAVMLGGTATSTGATPNQVTTYELGENAKGSYFKLQGRWVGAEGIDEVANGAQVVVFKAKLTGNPSIAANGEYANISGEFTAVRTRSDKKLLNIILEETQTELAQA